MSQKGLTMSLNQTVKTNISTLGQPLSLIELDYFSNHSYTARRANKKRKREKLYAPTPEDHFNDATNFYNKLKYKLAIRSLDEAIMLRPSFAEAWLNKGVILAKLGNYQEAIWCYDELIKLKPDFWEGWNNKGIVHAVVGDHKEAIKCYEKAIELSSNIPDIWYDKGNSLSEIGDNYEALKCYDKAIELKPDFSEAWNNKGIVLANIRRYEEAIKCYERSIELNPHYAEAWDNRGFVFHKLTLYEEALKCYNESIRLKPNLANAWYNRACLYSIKGEKEKAISDLKKALELDIYLKDKAKEDEDFKNIRDEDIFKRIRFAGAWDILFNLAGTIEGPEDWSSEHDHYIYGTPKHSEKKE
jgi:tetratricopeptide (TPR) repeat protein